MWAVLFEVTPKADRWDEYLGHAAALRPDLLRIDGFLDNRRFASRTRPGTLLSLSYWRDETALIAWRAQAAHQIAQIAGRDRVFSDYRLRVGAVSTAAAPDHRTLTIIEQPTIATPPDMAGLAGWDFFDGITVAGTTALLLDWRDATAMRAWTPAGGASRTDVAVRRDYGMHERDEAPQHFPPAPPN